jgi:peptidoglycan-N-acetylglucosamine deacetylase
MKYTLLYPSFKTKAVTFSYDDGVRQDETLIGILKAHHLRGTFNLNAGQSGEKKMRNDIDCSHLDLAKSLSLYQGMEIANHTLNHPHLEGLPYEAQLQEYEGNKERLSRLFGVSVSGSAYPYGTYDAETIKVLKDLKIHYARTTQSTYEFHRPYNWLLWAPTIHHNDPLLQATLHRFYESGEELALFDLWGHSYEFALNDNFALLEHFCGDIERHDEIWNATNDEIFHYISAAEMVYYRNGAFVNPSSSPIYLACEGKNLLIPPLAKAAFEEAKP